MMHRTGWFYSYFDSQLSCRVLQIDYNGTATTFFVLPDPKKEKELDEALSINTLTKWAQNVHRGVAMVSIPKFSISATYSLKEPLSQLGITEIFTDHADLSGVTRQPLKLSKVTHKAVLTVDESNWKTPFDSELTREEDFFVDHNIIVKVQMMQRTGWFYYYFDSQLSCRVLQIDYNGTTTTFFVLPDPDKEKELDEALSINTLNKWAKNVYRGVAMVSIPKFNISATYSLKEPLSQLGITEIFTDHADLSGVTRQPLKLSKVTHKAVLTVDETGTEAAGATAAGAIPLPVPLKLNFNCPFLFFVFN
ncbi:alpha-1-antitrypsin-like [Crotalus adamanteus]|uniref:Alpha-1-antitrypsin-like n=1 Tax=Crotalus adamanteus TaxID=8729 RepID=A0AAW1C6T9_CROAD